MKTCKHCGNVTKGKKKFNWIIFILGALLIGVGAVVYLLYYWLLAPKYCTFCMGKL
jgi:hypothetical protein